MNPFTEYALIASLIAGGLAALFFLILWDDLAHTVRRPHRSRPVAPPAPALDCVERHAVQRHAAERHAVQRHAAERHAAEPARV